MTDRSKGPSDSKSSSGTARGAREHVGQVIDRYTLVEQIGEGGFGSVWAADQREPVRRRVALKIIKLGMDTEQVIARFEAERQALAMMEHPNIAKVLDAGTTARGRPYFVMECIDGVPIIEYCDGEKLDTLARLDLFVRVCNAIQHAHQKGIIHRDIKPSNVLVTVEDDVPVPKVIDFGIAKATDIRLTEQTIFTQQGQFIGTPEYMSPEQAGMDALDIDTRSDVYSLGVLLYELLTGTTPFDPVSLRGAGLAGMHRMICEQDPPRPSTRLQALAAGESVSGGETPVSPDNATIVSTSAPSVGEYRGGTSVDVIADVRRTDARTLGRSLRGDLDWIVMRCLEKDRARRYETANGLAADIRRHLADEPVVASPPSARYRFKKFVRRNKVQVLAGSMVAVALVLAVAGTTGGMAWAITEKGRADEHAAIATSELERATEIKRLITDMLSSVDPEVAKSVDTTLLERILASADSRLSSGEIEDSRVVSEMSALLGDLYLQLGKLEDADRHLPNASESLSQSLGEDHPDALATALDLSELHLELDRNEEAEAVARRTLERLRRMESPNVDAVVQAGTILAFSIGQQGRHEESMLLLKEIHAIGVTDLGKQSRSTIRAQAALGLMLTKLQRFEESEELLRDLISTCEGALGEDHPRTLIAMINLGYSLTSRSQSDEAEKVVRRVVEIGKRVWDDDHPRLLLARSNLAEVYQAQRRYGEAERLYLEVLDVRRRVLGENHFDTLRTMRLMATMYTEQGRFDDATRILDECRDIVRRAAGEESKEYVSLALSVAYDYTAADRHTDAEPILERAVELSEKVLGADHDYTAYAKDLLGWTRYQLGRPEDADALLLEAIETYRALYGPGQAANLERMHRLGIVYEASGRFDDAERVYLETLEARRQVLGNQAPDTLWTMRNLSIVYRDTGQYDKAGALLAEELSHSRILHGNDHEFTLDSIDLLADVYGALGRPDDALPLHRERLQHRVDATRASDAAPEILDSAARALLTHEVPELRDPDIALSLAQRATEGAETGGGESLWRYLDTLALAQRATGDATAAAETQRRAISLMPDDADPTMAARLAEYESAQQQAEESQADDDGG